MRVLASILTAAVMAVAVAGCSKSTTEQTAPATTMAPQAAATTAMMPKTNQKMAAMSSATKLPMYPGAKTEAAGSSGMMGTGSAAGSVMSTADSFDKVYKWYQSHMPAGSEKSHASVGGTETAVFLIGAAGKTQQSVTISRTPATSGKTMITLAKVTK